MTDPGPDESLVLYINIILYFELQKEDFQTPKPYHFKPSGVNTLITVVYPSQTSQEDLGKIF